MSAGTRAASGETRLKPDSARTSRSRSASTIRPMRRCRPTQGSAVSCPSPRAVSRRAKSRVAGGVGAVKAAHSSRLRSGRACAVAGSDDATGRGCPVSSASRASSSWSSAPVSSRIIVRKTSARGVPADPAERHPQVVLAYASGEFFVSLGCGRVRLGDVERRVHHRVVQVARCALHDLYGHDALRGLVGPLPGVASRAAHAVRAQDVEQVAGGSAALGRAGDGERFEAGGALGHEEAELLAFAALPSFACLSP